MCCGVLLYQCVCVCMALAFNRESHCFENKAFMSKLLAIKAIPQPMAIFQSLRPFCLWNSFQMASEMKAVVVTMLVVWWLCFMCVYAKVCVNQLTMKDTVKIVQNLPSQFFLNKSPCQLAFQTKNNTKKQGTFCVRFRFKYMVSVGVFLLFRDATPQRFKFDFVSLLLLRCFYRHRMKCRLLFSKTWIAICHLHIPIHRSYEHIFSPHNVSPLCSSFAL